MHLDARHRIKVQAHRGSRIPNRAAQTLVAWHRFLSVGMATIGQAHVATTASPVSGSSPLLSSAGGELDGARLIGQDKIGFKRLRLPLLHQLHNTSIYDTCLTFFEFQSGYTAYAFLSLFGAHAPG
jgi:hypothetical protein